MIALSAPAVPLVGEVLGYTLSPIVSRVMWPLLMAKIFGPRSVPKKFESFPKEMALRPSQIRASAAESALMIPDAFHFRDEYANLKMPVVIVAGDEDRLVDIDAQSTRLHRDVPQSRFHRVPGTGHMIHQTAPGVVMSAINEVAEIGEQRPNTPRRSVNRLDQNYLAHRARRLANGFNDVARLVGRSTLADRKDRQKKKQSRMSSNEVTMPVWQERQGPHPSIAAHRDCRASGVAAAAVRGAVAAWYPPHRRYVRLRSGGWLPDPTE